MPLLQTPGAACAKVRQANDAKEQTRTKRDLGDILNAAQSKSQSSDRMLKLNRVEKSLYNVAQHSSPGWNTGGYYTILLATIDLSIYLPHTSGLYPFN